MKNIQNSFISSTQTNEQNINGHKGSTVSDDTRNVLLNHLSSFLENDLKAVMSDYTNESVLITQLSTYTGLAEIEAFFAELVIHFPKQKSSFDLEKMIVRDELAYIVWNAKTPSLEVPLGSDTFILKDGKINQQTFVGQLNFIN